VSAPGRAEGFLTTLWRYFSAASLYDADHPHRRALVAEVYRSLTDLLNFDPRPSFSILDGEVVYGDGPLRDLKAAGWPARLAEADVGRLEFRRGVAREEVDAFLGALDARLRGDAPAGVRGDGGPAAPAGATAGGDAAAGGAAAGRDAAAAPAFQLEHVRFGPLGFLDPAAEGRGRSDLGGVELAEEAGALEWLHEEAADNGAVPVAETLAIVQSLSVGMHGAARLISPFLTLKESDEYTAGHCINVAILAMSLAEEIGLPAVAVRGIGAAGLLHDVGKVTVPSEILNKPGRLTDEERTVIERHPVEGCRILLDSGDEMALPAVVAYEHHIGTGGGGYPRPRFERTPMLASRVVQVCDFYDALRTRRRYRAPLPAERVVGILRENAGSHLDPALVEPFVSMIERWDPATLLDEAGGSRADRAEDRTF
jgi:putative nucleotidyltransferase with HDIG domain